MRPKRFPLMAIGQAAAHAERPVQPGNDGKGGVLEGHAPDLGMIDPLVATESSQHILSRPEQSEVRADSLQRGNETFEIGVTGITGALCAKHRKRRTSDIVSIDEQLAMRLMREDDVHDVALVADRLAVLAELQLGRGCRKASDIPDHLRLHERECTPVRRRTQLGLVT